MKTSHAKNNDFPLMTQEEAVIRYWNNSGPSFSQMVYAMAGEVIPYGIGAVIGRGVAIAQGTTNLENSLSEIIGNSLPETISRNIRSLAIGIYTMVGGVTVRIMKELGQVMLEKLAHAIEDKFPEKASKILSFIDKDENHEPIMDYLKWQVVPRIAHLVDASVPYNDKDNNLRIRMLDSILGRKDAPLLSEDSIPIEDENSRSRRVIWKNAIELNSIFKKFLNEKKCEEPYGEKGEEIEGLDKDAMTHEGYEFFLKMFVGLIYEARKMLDTRIAHASCYQSAFSNDTESRPVKDSGTFVEKLIATRQEAQTEKSF